LFAQPGIARSGWISLSAGLITTTLSLVIVAAFFAAWSGTATFQRVQRLVSPLLSIPHAAAAFGLAFMIAPSGWIMRLISPELNGITRPPDLQILNDPFGFSMMLGLVAKEVPFLFLVTLAAMPQAKPAAYSRMAVSLGYGRMAAFFHSVWPQIYPQIRLAVFAVIAYASSVVDVALILGPTNPPPLAIRLVEWMGDSDLSKRFLASAGAVLQLAVTASALLIWIAGERIAGSLVRRLHVSGRRMTADRGVRYTSGFLMFVLAGLVFSGLAILGIWSVAGYWAFPDALPDGFTLKTWSRQLSVIDQPFLITLVLGLVSTALAIAIALACLEREARTGRTGGTRALGLVYLPLIVPQPAFVFGLQMLFLAVGLNASFIALAVVHLVFVLPYAFLSLSDPWRAFDRRYLHAAASMGIGQNRVFWQVRLPMLLRAVLTAAAIGFAVSIGQYLPTVLIGAGRWPTLTTEAVALASGGDRRVIGVYAFLQMTLPLVGFVIASLIPALLFAKRSGMRASL
jgi:putative thiamine transport system permease protein